MCCDEDFVTPSDTAMALAVVASGLDEDWYNLDDFESMDY